MLLLGEVALANNLARARLASRLLQVQQVRAINHLLQTASKGDDLRLLLIVLGNEAGKDMPDQKPTRRSGVDSPDDPNSGRPAWDQQRRRGGNSIYRESRGGNGSARRWDSPERSARRWDE